MIYTEQQIKDFKQQHFAYLKIEEQHHILTIQLNRPKQKNALNEILLQELAYVLSYAHYTNDIRVINLTAAGDIFCAGADLKTLMGHRDTTSGSSIPTANQKIILGDLWEDLHKPCIAKVCTPVYAGGFLLLGGCTHVLATASSSFTLSEVKRGIWPFQVMASLLKIMPERKVLDWCIQGKTWSAAEAEAAGLVTDLVAEDTIDKRLQTLSLNIASNAPSAIRLGLKAYRDMQAIPEEKQQAFLQQRLMELLNTKDAQEGIMAFRQKRKPNWTGE